MLYSLQSPPSHQVVQLDWDVNDSSFRQVGRGRTGGEGGGGGVDLEEWEEEEDEEAVRSGFFGWYLLSGFTWPDALTEAVEAVEALVTAVGALDTEGAE